jgi:hypothetical protein
LDRYARFSGVPLVIGEFAILHDEAGNRLHDGDTSEYGAGFYAAVADRVYRHNIRQVYEWAQTTGGVRHPRTEVIGMLNEMAGGMRLETPLSNDLDSPCGCIAARCSNGVRLLLYNHTAARENGPDRQVHVTWRDPALRAGTQWLVTEKGIDAGHGIWVRVFNDDCAAAGIEPLPKTGQFEGSARMRYGKPGDELFNRNSAKYAELGRVPVLRKGEKIVASSGELIVPCLLPGHSVRLLHLVPA